MMTSIMMMMINFMCLLFVQSDLPFAIQSVLIQMIVMCVGVSKLGKLCIEQQKHIHRLYTYCFLHSLISSLCAGNDQTVLTASSFTFPYTSSAVLCGVFGHIN